jgi:DNA repair protein RadC
VAYQAAAIIAAHNHPSGNTMPSPEDVRLTTTLREAGELLDIELLDHLVIGRGAFLSMRERNLGFSKSYLGSRTL